ncbi:four helix bundle protein [Hymenobacter terrigena]
MAENILKSKSFAFAVRVVRMCQFLQTERREFILAKQLLRCGTAIGSMVREAEYAESKSDFIHKLAIAQKEANETLYWIKLLTETAYLTSPQSTSIYNDGLELLKLLTASIKTAKVNKQKD